MDEVSVEHQNTINEQFQLLSTATSNKPVFRKSHITSITLPTRKQVTWKITRKTLKQRLGLGIMYQHPRIYEFVMWMNDPTHLIMRSLAGQVAGTSVLDCGCGTATLQRFLPQEVKYLGLDLNEDFLAYAQQQKRGSLYKRNVLTEMADFKADTVILSDILHHVTPNHQKLLTNAIHSARKKVLISACFEKEEGPFTKLSEFIGRRIMDNDGLNEQREGAGWLKLAELLTFLKKNGATNFQKVLSHIHCEIIIE